MDKYGKSGLIYLVDNINKSLSGVGVADGDFL